MRKIFIARNRQQLGSFDLAEIRAGLAEGRFFLTDLAWREGLPSWVELRQLLEMEQETTTVPPYPQSANPVSTAVPEIHSPTPQPAWERRAELGTVRAAIETIRQILFEPAKTFENFPAEGPIARPIVFSLILFFIAIFVNVLYQVIWYSIFPNQFPGDAESDKALFLIFTFISVLIFGPILMVISMFIYALIIHFSLWICGAVSKNFQTTARVLFYVHGASLTLNLIPFIGGLIQIVWGLILTAAALWRTHNTELWRVILALMLPLLICCSLTVFLFVLALSSIPLQELFK